MAIILLSMFSCKFAIAEDIVYTDREIIRNGAFEDYSHEAWFDHRCDITSLVSKDGTHSMGMDGGLIQDDDRYFFQQLTIPTELESAAIRFDFRADEDYVIGHPPVQLQIAVAKGSGFDTTSMENEEMEAPPLETIGVIHEETISAAFDWKGFSAELDHALIAKMQAAHDAGELVFLLFYQTRIDERLGFELAVDNVSFTVNGTQRVPEMHGKIAYLENDAEGDPYRVGILDPNDGSSKTIWTHPDGKFGNFSNVAWKPDATELAFVSDHNFQFSILTSSIYAIKPDGSGLHRIPHILTPEEIEAGNYPRVTVHGALKVESGVPGAQYSIIMGLNGADEGEFLSGSEGETVGFTLYDVPLLDDPNFLSQAMIMQFSGGGCSAGIEYAAANGIVVNGSVDIGTTTFFATNCVGSLLGVQASDLSYKYDGSEIGFSLSLLGLNKVPIDAERETDIVELEPDAGYLSSELAWSPMDNRFLYIDFLPPHIYSELFVSEEGGEPRLLIDRVENVIPAWLPDGSGFLYVGKPDGEYGIENVIFQYDFDSMEIRRLTYFRREEIDHLGISPDGRYIAFQLHNDREVYDSDLWIMDRLNPADVWPIPDSSHYRGCQWSPTDVASSANGNNNNPDNGGPVDTGGGGGGGGCFISIGADGIQ
jgi:hypothetical protein